MTLLPVVNLGITTVQQYEFIMEMLTHAKYSLPHIFLFKGTYLKLSSKFILSVSMEGAGQSQFAARYPLCLRV